MVKKLSVWTIRVAIPTDATVSPVFGSGPPVRIEPHLDDECGEHVQGDEQVPDSGPLDLHAEWLGRAVSVVVMGAPVRIRMSGRAVQ